MNNIFYSLSLTTIIVNFLCLFIYLRILKYSNKYNKTMPLHGLKFFVLIHAAKFIQLIYLFNIEEVFYARYSLLVDFMLYFPLSSLFWCSFLQLQSKARKTCNVLVAYSLVFLAVLTLGIIVDKEFIVENWLTIRTIAIFISLISLLMYFSNIHLEYIRGYFLYKSGKAESLNFPKSYAAKVIAIVYLNVIVYASVFLIGGHDGRLFANIYFSILNIYILNFWIQKLIMDSVKHKSEIIMDSELVLSENELKKIDHYFSSLYTESPVSAENNPEYYNKAEVNEEDDDYQSKNRLEYMYEAILNDVHSIINENKLYRKSDLKLQDLLKYINTNRTYLSAAINKNENTNFYKLILKYRMTHFYYLINEEKDILLSEAAFDSGFGTSKVLSRVFRQELDITPSDFKKLTPLEQSQILKDKDLLMKR